MPRVILSWLSMMLLAGNFLLPTTPTQAATTPATVWQDTGQTIANPGPAGLCFDSTRPDTLLLNDPKQGGTLALNWRTGQQTRLNDRPFSFCGPNGWLFAANPPGQSGYVRFSLDEPAGRPVEHLPTQSSQDGTAQVYALDKGQLWASTDGGLNWQARPTPPGGSILSFAVAAADAQALYLAVGTTQADQKSLTYDVYFSSDGGASWELRAVKRKAKGATQAPAIRLTAFNTRLTPLDYLELTVDVGGSGQNTDATVYTSADGGKTFNEAGLDKALFERVQVWYGAGGLLRLRSTASQKYNLAFSADGGHGWQKRDLPLTPKPVTTGGPATSLFQVANLPSELFLSDPAGLYYSADMGQNWQKLGVSYSLIASTPYAPLTELGYDTQTGKLYSYKLPDAAKTSVQEASPVGGPRIAYFEPTHHNLGGAFRLYWEQHGGLAQFGYPKTEPFRELNPSDGRVYLVQYFERNRFELHPENVGTPYEVLLGLLGNQLAETQRTTQPAFKPVEDAHNPATTFYPQTGHNLGGSFKAYWEQHGGLALYGYPISEEFEEVNPEDGQRYLVQYFERNRFEYHPANKGTPYEVLLGLLGNTLLKQKGWL